jgi:hypothetical protein
VAIPQKKKKTLGTPSSIALLRLKAGGNGFRARCGVKGRASRVDEVDFTPSRRNLRAKTRTSPLPRQGLRQRRVWTPWFLQVLFQFVWQDQLGAVVCPASGAAFQRLRATMVCAIRFISFQRALMHLPLL